MGEPPFLAKNTSIVTGTGDSIELHNWVQLIVKLYFTKCKKVTLI